MIEPSWRKPAGILGILLLILIWAVLVASLSPWIGGYHILIQMVFYLATGVMWILPLGPILQWMETGKFKHIKDPTEGKD
jgi:Protein of unknown function (DUF2842)